MKGNNNIDGVLFCITEGYYFFSRYYEYLDALFDTKHLVQQIVVLTYHC